MLESSVELEEETIPDTEQNPQPELVVNDDRPRNWSVKTQITDIDPEKRGKKYLKKRL